DDGDLAYDEAEAVLYGPKADGSWPAGVSLIGPPGRDGADGEPGRDGADGIDGVNAWHFYRPSGTTRGQPPSELGADGDMCLTLPWTHGNNTFPGYQVFGPKADGEWPSTEAGVMAPEFDKSVEASSGAYLVPTW